MADKGLNLTAPLLSVRRHPSGRRPPPPSSSSSSGNTVAADRQAIDGRRGRMPSLPFCRSDMRSGPVRKADAVPFVWEQSPGHPKGGSRGALAGPVGATLPGRVPKPLRDDEEDTIEVVAASALDDNVFSSVPPGGFGNPSAEKAPILEEEPTGGEEEGGEGEDSFSDALDSLSRAESCLMNCSVTGMSAAVDSREVSGRVSEDRNLREFMMDRFLPAAQAMAANPSPHAPRKLSARSQDPARRFTRNIGEGRPPDAPSRHWRGTDRALCHALVHRPLTAAKTDDLDEDCEEEEDEYDAAGHLSVKGCGFLPRFCLMNPVPTMRTRDRMPLPDARRIQGRARASCQRSDGDAQDEHFWEEVYKHKLWGVHQPLADEASKLTGESNQLSYWSDSQTADESSSFRRSTREGISPYRNDIVHSPLLEIKGLQGVSGCQSNGNKGDNILKICDDDGEKYWEIAPHFSSKHTSDSQSPVIEKNVYVDCVVVVENHCSKLTSSDTKCEMDFMDNDFVIPRESLRTQENLVSTICEDVETRHKFVEVVDPNESKFPENFSSVESHALDDLQISNAQEKSVVDALQALIPPPLPKSPSESWLCRTLPLVPSKNSSFLHTRRYGKKQVVRSSATDPMRDFETMLNKSMVPKVHMRFADVLARPASED